MKKSGNITIRLGPGDVKGILEQKPRFYSLGRNRQRQKSIERKLYEAVVEKFADVKEAIAEEEKARSVMWATQDSDRAKEIRACFRERRREIDEQYSALAGEEAQAVQELIQAEFDKAGITNFEAHGCGYSRKEKEKECKVETEAS